MTDIVAIAAAVIFGEILNRPVSDVQLRGNLLFRPRPLLTVSPIFPSPTHSITHGHDRDLTREHAQLTDRDAAPSTHTEPTQAHASRTETMASPAGPPNVPAT